MTSSNNDKPLRVEDLETQVDMPKYLSNALEVPGSDGSLVVYVGWASNLWFDGLDIRGGAQISKYNRRKVETDKRKIRSLIPFRTERVNVTRNDDSLVWSVSTDYDSYYFVSGGELRTGYDRGAHYRGKLLGRAANKNIALSTKLFDLLFEPIDEKIMVMYQEAKRRTESKRE